MLGFTFVSLCKSRIIGYNSERKGGRVVEGTGLENQRVNAPQVRILSFPPFLLDQKRPRRVFFSDRSLGVDVCACRCVCDYCCDFVLQQVSLQIFLPFFDYIIF